MRHQPILMVECEFFCIQERPEKVAKGVLAGRRVHARIENRLRMAAFLCAGPATKRQEKGFVNQFVDSATFGHQLPQPSLGIAELLRNGLAAR